MLDVGTDAEGADAVEVEEVIADVELVEVERDDEFGDIWWGVGAWTDHCDDEVWPAMKVSC